MPVRSVEEFLALLEKSKLLEPEQLEQARQLAADNDDPTEAARAMVRQGLLTRWQAGQLLAGRTAFYLGKYKLIDLLGRGGMGGVFLAEHVMMNRKVALKTLSKQVSQDPAALERFLTEARAIAALDHPNIVQAYSVDNEGDRYYLVMEYVDGENLQRIVEKEGPLDYRQAADYVRQAAEGLAHAHQRKVIHCDIKPSNLLVNEQGVVKILDMGLARLTGRDQRTEKTDNGQEAAVLGSVDYLAPEQGLETPEFDHRADIYSLGCTLYFLLTGHPPFPEGTLPERILKHQTAEPPPISEERSDVPAELVEICEKMMAKDPADRFQTAEEVAEALAGFPPPETKARPAPSKAVTESGPIIVIDSKKGPEKKQPIKKAAAVKSGAAAKETPTKRSGPQKPSHSKDWKESEEVEEQKKAAAGAGLLSTRKGRVILVVGALATVAVVLMLVVGIVLASGWGGASSKKAAAVPSGQQDKSSGSPKKPSGTGEPELEPELDPNLVVKPKDPPKPKEKPKEEPKPAEQPEPKPEPKPKEEPKPEPKPQPKPEEKPKEEPKPQEQPKPKEEPKPKPKEEPKPPPKKESPFKDLATAIDLPAPPKPPDGELAEPVSLGRINLENNKVELQLLGGRGAMAGKQMFDLKAEEGSQPQSWVIRFGPEASEAERIEVARIWIDSGQVSFRWLEGADKARTGNLRNCALRFTLGGESKVVALVKPQHAEPLALDMERGSVRHTFRLDNPPDSGALRLQVLGLEGSSAKPLFEPSDTTALKQRRTPGKDGKGSDDLNVTGMVGATFQEDKAPPIIVSVHLDWRPPNIIVSATSMFQLQPNNQLFPLTIPSVENTLRTMIALQQKYQTAANKASGQEKQQLEAASKAAQTAADQLRTLSGIADRLRKNTKFHYRVYVLADGHPIELYNSRLPPQ